jgi:hypothetical protein
MAQPTTRAEFKEWCLRKLGKPVIEINVDQDQADDRVDDYGSYSTLTGGYIKDYYGSGSHLGSLYSEAGVYIPSSGDTLNQFTEREVLECYTVYFNNSSIRDFYLKLSGQIYSGNIFTGIRELNAVGNSTGMGTRALADSTFSSASTFNTWDQWKWTTTSRWTSGTKYIHWY